MDQVERSRKWYLKNKALAISRANQWRKANPEKRKAVMRRYRQGNKAKIKEYNDRRYAESDMVKMATHLSWLKQKYGLTPETYATMCEAQKGLCAICFQLQTGRGFSLLCVDHDHATKAVRKLLCHECNKGLGCFKESPSRLEAAAAYLRAHGKG